MANVQDLIVKYLDEARLMQIATSVDDAPWVCTVYFAHDNLHNLYWTSKNFRRHSQEIVQNPKVACAIALPIPAGEPTRGLQVEGIARQVPAEEVEQLFEAYAERYNRHAMIPALQDPNNPDFLYQIKPTRIVLFDSLNFPDNPQQEWKFDEN